MEDLSANLPSSSKSAKQRRAAPSLTTQFINNGWEKDWDLVFTSREEAEKVLLSLKPFSEDFNRTLYYIRVAKHIGSAFGTSDLNFLAGVHPYPGIKSVDASQMDKVDASNVVLGDVISPARASNNPAMNKPASHVQAMPGMKITEEHVGIHSTGSDMETQAPGSGRSTPTQLAHYTTAFDKGKGKAVEADGESRPVPTSTLSPDAARRLSRALNRPVTDFLSPTDYPLLVLVPKHELSPGKWTRSTLRAVSLSTVLQLNDYLNRGAFPSSIASSLAAKASSVATDNLAGHLSSEKEMKSIPVVVRLRAQSWRDIASILTSGVLSGVPGGSNVVHALHHTAKQLLTANDVLIYSAARMTNALIPALKNGDFSRAIKIYSDFRSAILASKPRSMTAERYVAITRRFRSSIPSDIMGAYEKAYLARRETGANKVVSAVGRTAAWIASSFTNSAANYWARLNPEVAGSDSTEGEGGPKQPSTVATSQFGSANDLPAISDEPAPLFDDSSSEGSEGNTQELNEINITTGTSVFEGQSSAVDEPNDPLPFAQKDSLPIRSKIAVGFWAFVKGVKSKFITGRRYVTHKLKMGSNGWYQNWWIFRHTSYISLGTHGSYSSSDFDNKIFTPLREAMTVHAFKCPRHKRPLGRCRCEIGVRVVVEMFNSYWGRRVFYQDQYKTLSGDVRDFVGWDFSSPKNFSGFFSNWQVVVGAPVHAIRKWAHATAESLRDRAPDPIPSAPFSLGFSWTKSWTLPSKE
nr:MAG: hypothetical protein H1BulkLitter418_000002 [Fusariviridae sp.]